MNEHVHPIFREILNAAAHRIPMPTTANGFTQEQLEEIRKAREQNERDGTKFVGDSR